MKKLSYRRAWLLLQDIERVFGGVVLERRTGGKAGGGAALNARAAATSSNIIAAPKKRTLRAIKADLEALNRLKS